MSRIRNSLKVPIKHSSCNELYESLLEPNWIKCFFSTAQITLKVFEKKCTKIKNAFELSADFYAYVLVDVEKLLFKQAGADPRRLGNYNGAIDFRGAGLPGTS